MRWSVTSLLAVALSLSVLFGCNGVEEQGPEPITVFEGSRDELEWAEFVVDDEALFWARWEIMRTSLEGGDAVVVGGHNVRAFAIDDQRVFFTDYDGMASLLRAGGEEIIYYSNKNSGGWEALSSLGLDETRVFGVADGQCAKRLIVSDKANSGGTLENLPQGAGSVIVGDGMLFTDVDGTLMRLDEGQADFIEVGFIGSEAGAMHATSTHVYWRESPYPQMILCSDESPSTAATSRPSLSPAAMAALASIPS